MGDKAWDAVDNYIEANLLADIDPIFGQVLRANAAGGLPPEAVQTVVGFLKLLAREMIVRAPGDLAHTVAAIRRQAAAIAIVETEDSLQAAASLRIIAAALEDYPEFFRRP